MDRDGDGRPDQRAGVDSGVEARVAAEGMGRDRGFYAGFGPESCAATEAGGASSALVWSAGAGAR